jgi:hypothetical protein
MKTVVARSAIAIMLALGSWYAWSEADSAERRADATQRIVTLRFADVPADADAMTTATVAYWLGQYGDVTRGTEDTRRDIAEDTENDAALLLMAANAAFREAERNVTAQKLDGVLQAYASAMKASARNDAAYNYEYVSRLRDQVAKAQGKGATPRAPAVAAVAAGDLPAGPTIHGRPGAPPPEAKMEDFQMLAPLEFGDRESQPEATPGAKRERKG